MTSFKVLYDFLQEYVLFFQNQVEFEKNKFEVILSNDLTLIEENILLQQVQAKKVEAMEVRRQRLLESLGYKGKTFQEIIQLYFNEELIQLNETYQQLERAFQQIQYYNRKSMDLIKMNLRLFEPSVTSNDQSYDQHTGSR